MDYLGDRNPGDVIDHKFLCTTSAGVPTTPVGLAMSVYKDNGNTESTAGITTTIPFDSRAGLAHVRITTSSDATFYSVGSDFQLVITTGAIGSISLIGTVVAGFSLQNRNFLRPTVAGRALDVSSGGEAGVDWNNVGSPTTTQNLSGTTVKTATDIATQIAALNNLSAANVNAEVVDALNVDTYAEVGQEAPVATQTIRKMLAYLYKAWRNKSTQDATTYKLYADDTTTVDQKATTGDDLTTFTRGEVGTGP